MNFVYDGYTARLFDNKYVNIVQDNNPYINTVISNKPEAEIWLRQCLSHIYDAMPLYMKILSNDDKFITGETYRLFIKESTGNLTGSYSIIFNGKSNKIEHEAIFVDGEAIIEIKFKNSDVYEIDLDNEFFIGNQKYIYIIDNSNDSIEAIENNGDNERSISIINVED